MTHVTATDTAARSRPKDGEVPGLFEPGAIEHAALVVAAEQRDIERVAVILAWHPARAGLALLAQVNPTYAAVALRQALQIVLRDLVPDSLVNR